MILVSGTISVRLSFRSLHAVLTAGEREELHLVRTRAAGLQFAIFAFKDIPMRSRVTHRAYPLNQSRFRFEEVEGVVTMAREIGKRKLGCAFLTNKIRNSTHRFYISFPSYPQSEELLSVEQRPWRETGTSIFT